MSRQTTGVPADIIGVRSFLLITGASRGFGRSLAIEFGKVVGAGSTLLLIARNKEELEVCAFEDLTSAEIQNILGIQASSIEEDAFSQL